VLTNTPSKELEDFVGAEFRCPYAAADSNYNCIQIRQKTLECYWHHLHLHTINLLTSKLVFTHISTLNDGSLV